MKSPLQMSPCNFNLLILRFFHQLRILSIENSRLAGLQGINVLQDALTLQEISGISDHVLLQVTTV